MGVESSLYRALLCQARQVQHRGFPVTGVVGAGGWPPLLAPLEVVRGAFRSGHGAIDDAFKALRMLTNQAAVLSGAEEETRQALGQWCRLQQQHAPSLWSARPAADQVAAAAAGARLVQRLVQQQAEQQVLLEEEAEDLGRRAQEEAERAGAELEEMATQVRDGVPPDLLASAQASTPTLNGGNCAGDQLSRRWAELLSQAMFRQRRWKYEPVEWVYDGLAPALLDAVVVRRKGTPLVMALAYALVAQRLGLHPRLVCARDSELPGMASGPVVLQDLPPEVAARQAGRTIAGPPAPNTWLVELQAGEFSLPVYVDVTRKGAVMDAAAASSTYPGLQAGARSAHQADPGGASIMAVWVDMARTMVLAHQRRGESDVVAHWIYQLLALDPHAQEWGHVLQSLPASR